MTHGTPVDWQTVAAWIAIGVSFGSLVGSFLAWLVKFAWGDRLKVEGRLDDGDRCILDHEGRIKELELTHQRWDDGHALDKSIKAVEARVEGHDKRLDSHGKRLDKIETKLETK